MLNPPPGLTADDLIAALAGWPVHVADMEYLPLGFGSHHWSVTDPAGARWFVTVDEMARVPLDQLRNALAVPRTLCDHGYDFVLAPERNVRGTLVEPIGDQFAVSVLPWIEGEGFYDGEWDETTPEHRQAMPGILAELHSVPEALWGAAGVEDFAVQEGDVLRRLLAGSDPEPVGPFTTGCARLVASRAPMLRRLLDHYESLVAVGRGQRDRFVLTHGEPHPGNTMLVDGRYVLIDWDTALIAPPERDLYNFGLGDPTLCELYSLRWDLSEVGVYSALFMRPHTGGANERTSWGYLVDTMAKLETTAASIDPSWTSRR